MLVKASDLDLTVVKIQQTVLLVDPKPTVRKEDGYCWDSRYKKLVTPEQNLLTGTHDADFYWKIIASTKPLEGVPLLVIENGVHYLADVYGDSKLTDNPAEVEDAFIAGYNKARETYKFTEEDLRGVFLIGLMENISGILNERELDKSEIESLFLKQLKRITKKELWIEVEDTLEDNGQTDHTSYPTYVKIPKITNNKIKAVWK